MPRAKHTTFGQGQTFSHAETQVRRRRLEAIRDQQHAAEIRAFHQAEVERTRARPAWRLPEPPQAA